ncbi:hypothetical protein VKA52_18175 [Halobacillus sp. HZG1]|uniref:hypothetical protein n=1 Tax=Halobacillus sp. HZG1 TaxID=3111769 RepID=UPI002DB7A129|nr:hypothetical protein [Halobacillus sp. HZG1]MEC3885653.1 hypothetical protein [Halobacillus sp. HZG1]
MKIFFLLASITIPVALLMNQAATGMVASLLFLLTGAYFSKPRFRKYTDES